MTEAEMSKLSRWRRLEYFRGEVAQQNGRPITDNPNPPQSEAGILWDWGWADSNAGNPCYPGSF